MKQIGNPLGLNGQRTGEKMFIYIMHKRNSQLDRNGGITCIEGIESGAYVMVKNSNGKSIGYRYSKVNETVHDWNNNMYVMFVRPNSGLTDEDIINKFIEVVDSKINYEKHTLHNFEKCREILEKQKEVNK